MYRGEEKDFQKMRRHTEASPLKLEGVLTIKCRKERVKPFETISNVKTSMLVLLKLKKLRLI